MQAQALVCFLNLDILIMEVGGGLSHFQIKQNYLILTQHYLIIKNSTW